AAADFIDEDRQDQEIKHHSTAFSRRVNQQKVRTMPTLDPNLLHQISFLPQKSALVDTSPKKSVTSQNTSALLVFLPPAQKSLSHTVVRSCEHQNYHHFNYLSPVEKRNGEKGCLIDEHCLRTSNPRTIPLLDSGGYKNALFKLPRSEVNNEVKIATSRVIVNSTAATAVIDEEQPTDVAGGFTVQCTCPECLLSGSGQKFEPLVKGSSPPMDRRNGVSQKPDLWDKSTRPISFRSAPDNDGEPNQAAALTSNLLDKVSM
ncbi:unnamed protein product, partial [Protopolystoma xenopodis]